MRQRTSVSVRCVSSNPGVSMMLPRKPFISKAIASTSAVHDVKSCPTAAFLDSSLRRWLMNYSNKVVRPCHLMILTTRAATHTTLARSRWPHNAVETMVSVKWPTLRRHWHIRDQLNICFILPYVDWFFPLREVPWNYMHPRRQAVCDTINCFCLFQSPC